MRINRKRVFLVVVLFTFLFAEYNIAHSDSFWDDFYSQLAYDAAVQLAEESGYDNYEIVEGDDNNVKIILQDTPKAILPPEKEMSQDDSIITEETKPAEGTTAVGTEGEYETGLRLLEEENIVDAMKHFLKALPDEKANDKINEIAYDYVDELMFAENYQAAQDFMLEHPFDGYEQLLAECNDHCFLADLAKGLNARWKESNQDVSTWPDKKVREWYQKLVQLEMQYIDKYTSMGFSDSRIANYAYAYIGALQSQLTGSGYYGIDSEKFNDSYFDHGADVRARMIYLINKQYGIETHSAYNRTLKQMIDEGSRLQYMVAIKESLSEQLSLIELSFEKYIENHNEWMLMKPFPLKNTSGFDAEKVEVYVVTLDQNDDILSRDRVFLNWSDIIRDGDSFTWGTSGTIYKKMGLMIKEPFSSLHFECEIYDPVYNNKEVIRIEPINKYSWDGKELIVNGSEVDNGMQTAVSLEEVKSYWTEYYGNYVPCVEFVLRNTGKVDIKEATFECVFIEKDTNTEWSREKYYAVSRSDAPLQPGRGRNVTVYSDKGYERKTRKVAEIEVEIYLNGSPIEKTDVNKP